MIISTKYGLSCLGLLLCLWVSAQPSFNFQSKWDYIPSGEYERINKIIAISNGQLLGVGETSAPFAKSTKGYLLILNEDGSVKLRKSFGNAKHNSFNSVVQNLDGTFTIIGFSKASAKSSKRAWVLQIDIEGNEILNKHIPSTGKGNDELLDVAINKKGEVMAIGWKNDGQSNDVWLVRIDQQEIKERQIGRGELGPASAIVGAQDDGFLILGNVGKKNKRYFQDAWLKKVDNNGDDLWAGPRYLGGKGLQRAYAITQVSSGGYVIAGTTSATGGKTYKWLNRISNEGETEWTESYNATGAEVANDIIELSAGGFAVVGQNKSVMPRMKHFAADIIITNAKGEIIDSETFITGASGGNELGLSLAEGFNGDLVATGCLIPEKSSNLPRVFVSAGIYKPYKAPNRYKGSKEDTYGDALSDALQFSNITFVDANRNQSLDAGERGYFMIEVSNKSQKDFDNIVSNVSSTYSSDNIDFWEKVQIGTLRAGQRKTISIPVKANRSIEKGDYTFGVSLQTDGKTIGSTSATLSSTRPDPAELVAEGSFSPLKNPSAGETITLTVDVLNAGGLASAATDAYFTIPVGVQSLGSERITIPSLGPNKSHQHQFRFSFKNTFRDKVINIRFETRGNGTPPVLKTFQLELDGQQGLTMVPDEMFWVSHDPDESGSRNFEVNTNQVGIKLKALSRKQLNKRNFSVLVNSRKAQGQKMDEVDLSKPVNEMGRYRQTYTNKIRLKEGVNKIVIEYDYGDGKKFKSRELTFNYTPQGKPRLLVISIGVPYDNLKYTTKDASDFAQLYESLKGNKQGFKEIDVNVFNTKTETKTNTIREVFEKLSHHRSGFKLKKEDLLVVYISAHGKVNNRGEFLLMPSDYKPEAEKTYSINFENDILEELKYVNCKKLVFVDACHSGNAFNGTKDWSSEEAASQVMYDLMRTAPGIEIIASCSYNEFSYEDESWGNGAFTKAISEAFTNKRVPTDSGITNADVLAEFDGDIRSGGDGKISLKELKQFIQQRVPYLVKTTKVNPPTGQNPSNKSTDLLPENMGIYYLSGR